MGCSLDIGWVHLVVSLTLVPDIPLTDKKTVKKSLQLAITFKHYDYFKEKLMKRLKLPNLYKVLDFKEKLMKNLKLPNV